MILFNPASAVLDPVRAGLWAVGRRSALVIMAATLGAVGVTSLIGAAFAGLIPVVGVAGALALNGLTLMLLAIGAFGLSRWRGPPAAEPQRAMATDPLVQLVFDLSFNLGSRLTRRRT